MRMIRGMRFPGRFDSLSDVQVMGLMTKVVSAHGGQLSEIVYANLSEAAKAEDLSNLAGPFGDSVNGQLCIRFETTEACKILSA